MKKYINKIMILTLVLMVLPMFGMAADTYSTPEMVVCDYNYGPQCNPTDTDYVTVPTAGKYELAITMVRTNNNQNHEDMKFYINGVYGGKSYDSTSKTTTTENFGKFQLKAGKNTIRMDHATPGNTNNYNSVHAWFKFSDCNCGGNDTLKVTTDHVAQITTSSAQIWGTLLEGNNVHTWFRVSKNSTGLTCWEGGTYNYAGLKDEVSKFAARPKNLEANTKYYYRACGSDNVKLSSTGGIKSFVTDSVPLEKPEMFTNSANNVGETSATLRGQVKEGDGVTTWLRLSTSSGVTCSSGTKYNIGVKDKGDWFGKAVSGLNDNTTYYYRACGQNSAGSDSGNLVSFKTDGAVIQDPADVSTNSATNVGEDSATLKGLVVDGDNVTSWFRLSTSSSVTCSTGTYYGVGTYDKGDSFSKPLYSLNDNTTYYYRACGSNAYGSDTGNLVSFRTDSGYTDDLEITTNSASSVDEDSARLNGEVDGADNVDVWFVYSDSDSTPECDDNDEHASVSGEKDDGDSFYKTIYGLDEDTRYYFRACGETNSEEDDGSVRSFTTDDGDNNDDLEITTNSASSVDEDSARLNGEVDGADNVDVWFVYSDSDSTPECDDNDEHASVSGEKDDGDSFYKTIYGLDEDTRYYFRACGETNSEEDDGSVRSFTTDDGDNNDDLEITTNSASSVDEDSARLNGEVDGADNVDVWFVYSDSDSTPECDDNDEHASVSGEKDDGDSFYKTIYGLDEDTRYYFRACGETNSEEDDGSVRSFTTDDGDTPETIKAVVTNTPTGVGITSATLHSINVNRVGNVIDSFEYGRTSALGSVTSTSVVNTTTHAKTIYGLASSTRYYYRAVMVDEGITYRGLIKSFVTQTGTTPPIPPTPGPIDPPIVIVIEDTLSIDKWVSQEKTSGYELEIEAKPGDVVYYKVRVRNDTDETKTDVDVTDHIPFYLELDNERQTDDDSDKYVTWKIDRLRSRESRVFITEMRVKEDAPDTTIFSHAVVDDGDTIETTNDVVITIDEFQEEDIEDQERESNQTASIFGAGSGFFPDTILGWLLLIVIILVIAYLLYKVLGERNKNKEVRMAALIAAEREKINNYNQ